ncbi:MAG: hypothetical protein V1837_02090 [Candidatus Woesearchaeota archaeon]
MEIPRPQHNEFGKPETRVKAIWKLNPEPAKPETQEKYITFKIKPRSVERFIFVLIIIVLAAALIITNMDKGPSVANQTLSTPEQQELPKVQPVVVKNITPTLPVVAPAPVVNLSNKTVAKPVINQTKNLTPSSEGPIDPSLVDFIINRVVYIKKTDTWAKVTSIDVTIKNNGNTLRPLIKIYAFDESTPEVAATREIGSDIIFQTGIPKGEVRSFTLDTSDRPISFSDFDTQKTVRLQLYDWKSNDSVKQAVKTFTIS